MGVGSGAENPAAQACVMVVVWRLHAFTLDLLL